MKFIDSEHALFYGKKLEQMNGKTDVYCKALIYVLGISEITRKYFDKIFDIKRQEIRINSLNAPWQTSTSGKVTRMAFSLWNGCNYDSEEDAQKKKVSSQYNIEDIFCCSYATYFFEGIKIRYPEYTRCEEDIEKFTEEFDEMEEGI